MNLAFACSDWSSYHFFIDHQPLIMPFTDFPDHSNFDDHPLKGQVNVNCKRNVQCLHIFVRSSKFFTYVHVSYLRSCIHYVFFQARETRSGSEGSNDSYLGGVKSSSLFGSSLDSAGCVGTGSSFETTLSTPHTSSSAGRGAGLFFVHFLEA